MPTLASGHAAQRVVLTFTVATIAEWRPRWRVATVSEQRSRSRVDTLGEYPYLERPLTVSTVDRVSGTHRLASSEWGSPQVG